jgi:hypothetical protein
MYSVFVSASFVKIIVAYFIYIMKKNVLICYENLHSLFTQENFPWNYTEYVWPLKQFAVSRGLHISVERSAIVFDFILTVLKEVTINVHLRLASHITNTLFITHQSYVN